MRVLEAMRATIRHEMSTAVASYSDTPREQWVFEPPAQVALCAVQIWWTVDVNMTFQRLEEGSENALKDFNKKQVSRVLSDSVVAVSHHDLLRYKRQALLFW